MVTIKQSVAKKTSTSRGPGVLWESWEFVRHANPRETNRARYWREGNGHSRGVPEGPSAINAMTEGVSSS